MLDWTDVSGYSFNTLLLLESVQIGWLPRWRSLPVRELAVALRANPVVEWYLRHKCPEIGPWLDGVMAQAGDVLPNAVRAAEVAVLQSLEDLVVYAVDPAIYDAQPFLGWDSRELTDLADFTGATVIDVGAGTGRQTLSVAPLARTVYAVEPVANLRHYLKEKARRTGHRNVYVVDGLLTDLPFPCGFADVVMGGHVYGDQPEAEYQEMVRVTRSGGLLILIPANRDEDNEAHRYLVGQGFEWSRFEEPRDGTMRKYWKRIR